VEAKWAHADPERHRPELIGYDSCIIRTINKNTKRKKIKTIVIRAMSGAAAESLG
jgi:hypothetical protein